LKIIKTLAKLAVISFLISVVLIIIFIVYCLINRDPRAHYSEQDYKYRIGDSVVIRELPIIINAKNLDNLDINPCYGRYMFIRTDDVDTGGDLTFFYPAKMEKDKIVCLAWLPFLGFDGRYPKQWRDQRLYFSYPSWRIRHLQVPRRYQIAYKLLYGGSINESITMIVNP